MPTVSGAGHDAVYMAHLAPAGMIFIPCKDGISHNEVEDAKPEHITAGCNVLLHAMLERAGVAGRVAAAWCLPGARPARPSRAEVTIDGS